MSLLQNQASPRSIYFMMFLISVLAVSCNTDKVNPAISLDEQTNKEILNGTAIVLKEGNFMAGAHKTSGKAQIVEFKDTGIKKLIFTDFMTDSGPDLRVYLSNDTGARDFEEISKEVKNGNVTYTLREDIDLDQKKYILIWCKAFSVNFGSAALSNPE